MEGATEFTCVESQVTEQGGGDEDVRVVLERQIECLHSYTLYVGTKISALK